MPTRIEELASNSTMYYRGDECLEIAPFDNYYMFTIYKESSDKNAVDHSVPLNLTHIGFIYLLFLNGDDEIRIPNYTDAIGVDMANGQVVFKINKETAKKILAMTAGVFYITSQMTDGKTAGDETVLYTGRWVDFATGMAGSLTSTINSLNATVTELQATLDSKASEYASTVAIKDAEIESLNKTIAAYEETIKQLQSVIETYNSDVVDYITANILKTEYKENGNNNNGLNVNVDFTITKQQDGAATQTTSSMEQAISKLSSAM